MYIYVEHNTEVNTFYLEIGMRVFLDIYWGLGVGRVILTDTELDSSVITVVTFRLPLASDSSSIILCLWWEWFARVFPNNPALPSSFNPSLCTWTSEAEFLYMFLHFFKLYRLY